MIGMFQRLAQKLQAVIGVGKITLVDDSGAVQLDQVAIGPLEVHDGAPNSQQFGFASNPPVGTDAVMVFIGGDRSNGVIIATGNQKYRLKGLASGDAALYDSRGQSVWLTPGGIVVNGAGLPMTVNNTPEVTVNASTSVTLNTPTTHCTGDLNADGNITSGKSITAAQDVADQGGTKTMAGMRATFNPHTHVDPQGGSVSPPSGSM